MDRLIKLARWPAPTHARAPPLSVQSTVLRAIYPRARGRLFLRGSGAGLDWVANRAPDEVDGDVSTFRLQVPPVDPVQVKLVRDDGAWMTGRNAVIGRGDAVVLRPAFDRSAGELSSLRTIDLPWGGASTCVCDCRQATASRMSSGIPCCIARMANRCGVTAPTPSAPGASTACSTSCGTSGLSTRSSSSQSTPAKDASSGSRPYGMTRTGEEEEAIICAAWSKC